MSGHLCWSTQPWYAWHVWSDVPGATAIFELMLNGGQAWIPHTVSVAVDEDIATITVPLIIKVEPTIGDTHPIFDRHGLWVASLEAGQPIYWEPSDYEGTTETWPVADARPDSSVILKHEADDYAGLVDWVLYPPWHVLPVLDGDLDGDFSVDDEVHNTVQSMIDEPGASAQDAIDEINRVAESTLAEIEDHRMGWRSKLFEIAALHDCAELLVPGTAHSPYRRSRQRATA